MTVGPDHVGWSHASNLTLRKINVSRIGHTSLFDTDGRTSNFFGDAAIDARGDLNNLLGNLTSDIVKTMDVPDFFTIYLRGYCRGMYSSNASAAHHEPRVMKCTNHSTMFRFSPTEMMERELPHNVTLKDLHWPSAIETAERALQALGTVWSLFYILSLLSIGIAVFLAAWGICFHGTLSALLTHGIDMVSYTEQSQVSFLIRSRPQLALFAITLASILSTVVICKGVDVINTAGVVIGIAAQKGVAFLGLTWAAAGCMLLATIVLFL